MDNAKLQRLKEVLSVPTHSRNEKLMIEYLEKVLKDKGFKYQKDKMGNIFVTKGKTEYFPLFVSHTDTVHRVNTNLKVVQLEEENEIILTGVDKETLKPSGIGGDDKCGVFLCLEMLDTLDNVKVAFFVSEEIGCLGSKKAVSTNPQFFQNVGYAIQYDSPKGNSMSMSLMGKDLFNKTSDFGEKVSPLILEHGINDWARHPYTDIWPLIDTFNFSCLNLAAGYHRYHTDNEYVVVSEVQNGFELGLKLHQELGENFYERKKEVNKFNTLFGYGEKQIINEEEDDDLFFDEEEDFEDFGNEEYFYSGEKETKNQFVDLWDYEEFNGGYDTQKTLFDSYGDHTTEFDW